MQGKCGKKEVRAEEVEGGRRVRYFNGLGRALNASITARVAGRQWPQRCLGSHYTAPSRTDSQRHAHATEILHQSSTSKKT